MALRTHLALHPASFSAASGGALLSSALDALGDAKPTLREAARDLLLDACSDEARTGCRASPLRFRP